MKKAFRYSAFLIILSLFLTGALGLFTNHVNTNISLTEGFLLILSFFTTAIITLVIFLVGQRMENKSQAFFTMVGVTLKFLLELIIALIWFLIAKKTSLASVLLFFVLYLSFTTFSIIIILNTLKNK